MKPLRLTMQAVGSYAGRQTIDFRSALESGLFGIYGPTGSGKSTIFNAMTFALFGEAARREQHVSTLRTVDADPTLLTEVELVFESGGVRYRIVRRPTQMRPARRGGGETEEKHKAWLFNVNGLDIDTLSDERPGKVIAETKVEAVDAAIERTLGYSAAQFRQIVLLPQGRFETFLGASSDERKQILRELFDVSLYGRITDSLREKASDAEIEIRTARSECDGMLRAVQLDSRDALAHAIVEAGSTHGAMLAAQAAATDRLESASKAYETAAATDKAFAEHVDAERELARIEAESAVVGDIESRLKLARVVESMADVDAAVITARRDNLDAAERHHEAVAAHRIGHDNAEAAGKALASLKSDSGRIEALRDRQRSYQTFQETIANSDELRRSAASASSKARADAKVREDAKSRHDALVRQHAESVRSLEAASTKELRRAELRLKAAERRQQQEAAEAFERATAQDANARIRLNELEQVHRAAEEMLARAAAQFQAAERALVEGHAQHLASKLDPGEPCPVCGSREHPKPARGTPGEERLAETHAAAKAEHEAAQAAWGKAAVDVRVAKENLLRRSEELAALVPPAQSASTLEATALSMQRDLEGLGPEADLIALEARRTGLSSQVEKARATLAEAEGSASSSATQQALTSQALADALKAVPLELRSTDALTQASVRTAKEIARYEENLAKLLEAERIAREELIKTASAVDHSTSNRTSAADRLNAAEKRLAARLEEHGLDDADFRARKSDVAQISAFERRVREHGQRLAVAAERIRKAAEAVQTADRPDIAAFKAARDAAHEELRKAGEDAIIAGTRKASLEKLASNISDEIARLDRLERDTAALRELAYAVAGQSHKKVDLETFAIATMFDRVLEAANLRLGPMTRGRYSLVREIETRGNARRGLDMSVEDAHSGHRRSPTTLSGGETFIAALALALGLSDVVESAHGNISLDTIFIDEGFGSLDSDGEAGTLEQVLQTLRDVGGRNRAVGLISHVPLVQQTIPNGFWITSTASGSRIEVRA